jgi:cytochrome c oxidase subunit 1
VDRLFYLSTYFGLGHPEVYIIVAGLRYCISETNASIFGYRAMIMSIIAIGFLSTIVWGIMFVSGMNPFFVQYLLYNTNIFLPPLKL